MTIKLRFHYLAGFLWRKILLSPGLKPQVSRSQDKQANHYTTAAHTTKYLTQFSGTRHGPHTDLTTCLLLMLSIYLQVFCQSHCALTNSLKQQS